MTSSYWAGEILQQNQKKCTVSYTFFECERIKIGSNNLLNQAPQSIAVPAVPI